MTPTAAVSRMTRDEAKILAHYAAGESAKEISVSTGASLGEVGLTLDTLCSNNRNLAHNLAVEYQNRVRAVIASKAAPAAPKTAPAPGPPAVPAPAPEKPQPAKAYEHNIDGIADMLDAAENSGNAKLERAARKVRELLTGLQADLAEHSRDARLREEQAQLEARLAEIRAQLKPKRTGADAAPAPAPVDAVDSKVVRVWAAANGYQCPAKGRVPGSVIAAYRKAAAA